MNEPEKIADKVPLSYSNHPRLSEYSRLVYPVISRRAGGLSLGINVNPDKKCSFDCVYCQVDRKEKISGLVVNVDQIADELEFWLQEINKEGGAYQGFPLKDIAIAGDGEPTTSKKLPETIDEIIRIKSEHCLDRCKIILFSNGTRINRSDLQERLPAFFASDGEIWFKLDFWDEESLKKNNGTALSMEKLINNLILTGKQHPIVFQSCFFSWDGETFRESKYLKYVKLIQRLQKEGVRIKLIQAYTLARSPADSRARPWSNQDLDKLYHYLKSHLSAEIEKYYQSGKTE